MNLQHIEIEGVQYPVKFSLNTRRLFCRERGIELAEFERIFTGVDPDNVTLENIENLALFILFAFREGARKSGDVCRFTIDDIVELFSDDPGAVEKIFKAYGDTEIKRVEEEGERKAQPI